jgi:hypothetical protein
LTTLRPPKGPLHSLPLTLSIETETTVTALARYEGLSSVFRSEEGVTKLPGSKSGSLTRLPRHRRRINEMMTARRTSPAIAPPTPPAIAPALSPPEDVLLGLALIAVLGSSKVVDGIGRRDDCVLVTGAAVRVVATGLDMIEDVVDEDDDEEADSWEEEEVGVEVGVVVGATVGVSVEVGGRGPTGGVGWLASGGWGFVVGDGLPGVLSGVWID